MQLTITSSLYCSTWVTYVCVNGAKDKARDIISVLSLNTHYFIIASPFCSKKNINQGEGETVS